MKIIKALKRLSVPVRGEKPSQFVRRQIYPAKEVIAVHEETLKTLPEGSYEIYSGDKFVKPKKNEEIKPVQEPVSTKSSEEAKEEA